jgi:hypothetical protein
MQDPHYVSYWLGGTHKINDQPAYVCLDLHDQDGNLIGETRCIEVPKVISGHELTFAHSVAEAFAKGAGVGPDGLYYDDDSTEVFANT